MSGATIDPARYEHHDVVPVRRALLSVSDKTGLLDLAAVLLEAGVELVSTGSTARTIAEAGHPVTEVADVTGFPESLDGRVKTLHPAVHAGILADRRLPEHRQQLDDLGIAAFDLVVVNLYPFAKTVAAGAAPDAIVEQIDIGGPALVRGSAKNHASVAIVVEPALYGRVAEAVRGGGTGLALRRLLAAKAFSHVAAYDAGVAAWFTSRIEDDDVADTAGGLRLEVPDGAESMSGWWSFDATPLRYGENSHQRAALLRDPRGHGIAQATQLHGKEMSYNNFVDADAAVRAAHDFAAPAVAIIKHANPCGIAVASKRAPDPIASAHRRAHECDPLSAFGGVIAANRVVTLGMAEQVKEIFTEVIVAPDYEPAALSLLKTKKTLRVLQLPQGFARTGVEYRHLSGGALVQTTDTFEHLDPTAWRLVSGEPADETLLGDLAFAWAACRAVKSNAILLAQGGASVGVGMGQVNRVDSCHLAVSRAGDRAAGAVAASDAFFPFADGLQVLIDAGVRAVVQPGGSVRDDEVVQAAERAGLTTYFTGERHFFH